ncbi:MAG: Na/Pi cotransporter family protein [Bacteroidaceae bacterium]|nr:Na/Pi cotransporter family protein [Bacteroidaceae bacterium]
METFQDYFKVSTQLLGALALLIYGMKVMSEALQKLAGPQLRHILGAMTTNRFTGMLTGAFVTCAVQSSSATTVMTVSFVNAGLLTLAQAISIIMGANIGTTLTAWIMSLGYNVDLTTVLYPAFFIGIILIYLRKYRYIGDFLFGIAFMFLSLVTLSATGKAMDLGSNEAVVSFFASFDTNSYSTILIFLLIGTIITGIVQSSAAVMAITILLCSTGVLPIYLGIALVMGENIGTTATANLAALGANTQARRAALAHLLFNVIGVIWIMCVFYPFVNFVCDIVGYDPQAGGQVHLLPIVLAMFHTCFNVTNTAVLIGFIPVLERLCYWIIKDNKKEEENSFRLQYIGNNIMQTPEIAVLQAQKETIRFAERVYSLYEIVKTMLDETSKDKCVKLFSQVEQEEDFSDKLELAIAHYLEKVSDAHLSDDTKDKIRQMMREISELESISDSCYNLARSFNRRQELNLKLTPELTENVRKMMQLTDDALKEMNLLIKGPREQQTMNETFRIENEINTLRNKLKAENIINVDSRKYDYSLGTMYIDIINECEKLGDYVVNVVEARLKKNT